MARRTRVGFTLVELLVVITTIGMLMALLLPAIHAVRESARRIQCGVNMDQIALAMHSYVTANRSFPGYRGNKTPDINNDRRDNPDASWFVAAAPQMEQSVIFDRWERFTLMVPPTGGRANYPLVELAICPSDPAERRTPIHDFPVSWLSYVVNAGRPDPDFPLSNVSPDRRQNGVFHNRNHALSPRVGLEMKDGASNTLMLSENIHAWYWSTVLEHHVSFVFHLEDGEGRFPEVYKINGHKEHGRNLGASVGWARPSSNHPGGVMASFCDRRSLFLHEDIHYWVYQQLMTPDGYHALCEVPATDVNGRPKPGSNKDYVLSAGDY